MNHPDQHEWEQEAAMEEWLQEQLRSISEEPVFSYLARFGDAIQQRVDGCRAEASALLAARHHSASLVRSAAAIEITIRFFLARPLVQGAFLSDEWAQLLANRILNGRAAEDRELLPAILRNWDIDITALALSSGSQLWQTVVSRIWPARNDCVHKGATAAGADAQLALECLDGLLSHVVEPIAARLGFTRAQTGRWSVVVSRVSPNLNPPAVYTTASPF